MTHGSHDLGTGVVGLVDTVPEAHEAEGVVLVLGPLQRIGDVLHMPNDLQHAQDGLIGPSVGWAPESSNARGNARKWIGLARACARMIASKLSA